MRKVRSSQLQKYLGSVLIVLSASFYFIKVTGSGCILRMTSSLITRVEKLLFDNSELLQNAFLETLISVKHP